MKEDDITVLIMDALLYSGIWAFVTHRPGAYRHLPLMKGIADILGIVEGGRFLAIEVKGPKARITPEQIEFIDSVNNSGGLGFFARSLEDVADKVKLKIRL